jgi:hypothetical protein
MRRAFPGRAGATLAGLLIAATPVASVCAADLRCDYTSKIDCTASGCAASAIAGAHLRLADAATLLAATQRATDASSLPTIQVCDGAACSPIRVRAARSGAFLNIAQDGGAHFVKMAMIDVGPGIRAGDFLEVAARFLTTATYVGSCPAVARPAAGR